MTIPRNDRIALKLAIDAARAESEGRRGQIEDKLREDTWVTVAEFAAGYCQHRALRLKVWQIPPCEVPDPEDTDNAGFATPDLPGAASDGRLEAAKLLRQMLALGISKYHPDPLAAIDEKQREAAS